MARIKKVAYKSGVPMTAKAPRKTHPENPSLAKVDGPKRRKHRHRVGGEFI
jgi:hypothetical protein